MATARDAIPRGPDGGARSVLLAVQSTRRCAKNLCHKPHLMAARRFFLLHPSEPQPTENAGLSRCNKKRL